MGAAFGQQYKLEKTIPLGGSGGWDYLAADSQNHRLYISHGAEVLAFDLASQAVSGRVTGLQRIHGIAVDPADGLGFISDGGANQVVSFKLADLSVQKRIPAGQNPDAILYDPAAGRVFAFNGRSQDVTVIDPVHGSVSATIKLTAKPEFAVSDSKGSVFVNLEDKNEIARIDSRKAVVTARWSIAPCDSPSGLAIDTAAHRLFSVCENERMAVVDSETGKVVATPPIGKGPDAAAFDAASKLAFSSNGQDGTLTVVKENGASDYRVAQTVTTARGARTMALDSATHRIYLVTADFEPQSDTDAKTRTRPSMKPGTFKLLVVSP